MIVFWKWCNPFLIHYQFESHSSLGTQFRRFFIRQHRRVTCAQPHDLLINLYKTSDEAPHLAKRAGRNCISFYDKIIQIRAPAEESFPVGVLSASSASGEAENG